MARSKATEEGAMEKESKAPEKKKETPDEKPKGSKVCVA